MVCYLWSLYMVHISYIHIILPFIKYSMLFFYCSLVYRVTIFTAFPILEIWSKKHIGAFVFLFENLRRFYYCAEHFPIGFFVYDFFISRRRDSGRGSTKNGGKSADKSLLKMAVALPCIFFFFCLSNCCPAMQNFLFYVLVCYPAMYKFPVLLNWMLPRHVGILSNLLYPAIHVTYRKNPHL